MFLSRVEACVVTVQRCSRLSRALNLFDALPRVSPKKFALSRGSSNAASGRTLRYSELKLRGKEWMGQWYTEEGPHGLAYVDYVDYDWRTPSTLAISKRSRLHNSRRCLGMSRVSEPLQRCMSDPVAEGKSRYHLHQCTCNPWARHLVCLRSRPNDGKRTRKARKKLVNGYVVSVNVHRGKNLGQKMGLTLLFGPFSRDRTKDLEIA